MTTTKYFLKLNEEAILKLPYCGPVTRRIYIILQRKGREATEEVFVQRMDMFTTNLIHCINRLRNHEISEIRYSCGLDGFLRIYSDEEEKLAGEYLCKFRHSMDKLKEKLGLPP